MAAFDKTLLIWYEKDKPKYFVVPEHKVSPELLELIRRSSNNVFSDKNTDEEHDDLWCLKAATTDDKNIWIPKRARKFKGQLVPHERYAPINDNIDLVIVIGFPGYR